MHDGKVVVTKQFRAEIAHRLPQHPGACQFIHGHSYLFEISVSSKGLDAQGMVMDFKTLKFAIQDIIGKWDHSLLLYQKDPLLAQREYLQEFANIIPFETIPTAENMAIFIARELSAILATHTIADLFFVECIRVWETTTSFSEWRRS